MAVSKKRKKSSSKSTKGKTKSTSGKLSEVILEFVAPLTDKSNDMVRSKVLVEFGILVWNIAVLPIEHRVEQRDMVIRSINARIEESEVELNEIFDYLIIRKDTIFNKDKRFIVNYEINEQDNELFLTVGSTQAKEV